MAKYKVLSTKALKASLVEKVKENGIELLQQEFISIKKVEGLEDKIAELLKRETLVFTSANAVNIVGKYVRKNQQIYRAHKVFCLQGKTKEAVLENGFTADSIAGEGKNASDLAKEIIQQEIKDVVFFCGSSRREDLPSILKAAGVEVEELAIYETLENSVVINDDVDGVLFFSPSAVKSFFTSNKLKEATVCFTIGVTTADAIKQHTTNKIIVSKEPLQEAITEALITYFQSLNQNND